MSPDPIAPSADILRLQAGVDALNELRNIFDAMECDGERERAWNYLSSRFGELEGARIPTGDVT